MATKKPLNHVKVKLIGIFKFQAQHYFEKQHKDLFLDISESISPKVYKENQLGIENLWVSMYTEIGHLCSATKWEFI